MVAFSSHCNYYKKSYFNNKYRVHAHIVKLITEPNETHLKMFNLYSRRFYKYAYLIIDYKYLKYSLEISNMIFNYVKIHINIIIQYIIYAIIRN